MILFFYIYSSCQSTYRGRKYSLNTLQWLQSGYTFWGKIKIVAKSSYRVRIEYTQIAAIQINMSNFAAWLQKFISLIIQSFGYNSIRSWLQLLNFGYNIPFHGYN